MVGKMLLKALGFWFLGFLLFSLCLGGALFFASWHTLPPEHVAVVREIWVREGPLFGPSALPFRIRVVENPTAYPKRFWVQPPPFGVVEEVLPLHGTFSLAFRVPLWRKDAVTGNPYDGSIALVGAVEAQVAVEDHRQFARKLDPLLAREATQEGSSLGTREDLLRDILRRDFTQRMLGELGRISQSLHFKFYFAQEVLKETSATSSSERKIVIWKYLEQYPWYKLEPQEMGKIVAEDAQIFEKIMTYLRREKEETSELVKLREEIREYFSSYIARNPQSYSQELWDYAIGKIVEAYPLEVTPEKLRSFTYQYVYARPEFFVNLLKNEEYVKSLTAQYGVTLQNLDVRILEDVAARYPELLR